MKSIALVGFTCVAIIIAVANFAHTGIAIDSVPIYSSNQPVNFTYTPPAGYESYSISSYLWEAQCTSSCSSDYVSVNCNSNVFSTQFTIPGSENIRVTVTYAQQDNGITPPADIVVTSINILPATIDKILPGGGGLGVDYDAFDGERHPVYFWYYNDSVGIYLETVTDAAENITYMGVSTGFAYGPNEYPFSCNTEYITDWKGFEYRGTMEDYAALPNGAVLYDRTQTNLVQYNDCCGNQITSTFSSHHFQNVKSGPTTYQLIEL